MGIHTISLGNWIAGFKGFKLTEINIIIGGFFPGI